MPILSLCSHQREPRRRIGGIKPQYLAIEGQRQRLSSLHGVHLSKAQTGADQARIQTNRLLKILHAFRKTLLLKSNGTQNRAGNRMSGWIGRRIGESQSRLPVSLIKPPLLDETCGVLQGLARISSKAHAGIHDDKPAQESKPRRHHPGRETQTPFTAIGHQLSPGSAWEQSLGSYSIPNK